MARKGKANCAMVISNMLNSTFESHQTYLNHLKSDISWSDCGRSPTHSKPQNNKQMQKNKLSCLIISTHPIWHSIPAHCMDCKTLLSPLSQLSVSHITVIISICYHLHHHVYYTSPNYGLMLTIC